MNLPFQQVDVFTSVPLKGNPLAVVIGADGLSGAQMAAFANWTNLSETAFLLQPTTPQADYRVRIFTPKSELPFAGHPTLGSCHVWLASGGVPKGGEIIQECGAGQVRVRRDGALLAFAAPEFTRRPMASATLAQIAKCLRLSPAQILASHWLSNPPGWAAVMLGSRDELLAIKPDFAAMAGLEVGVIAPADLPDAQFEVRGFAPGAGIPEDPVTGSLNAGLAQWLIGAGLAPPEYVASQGTVLGRAGRVHIRREGAEIWVGGNTVTCITGTLTL